MRRNFEFQNSNRYWGHLSCFLVPECKWLLGGSDCRRIFYQSVRPCGSVLKLNREFIKEVVEKNLPVLSHEYQEHLVKYD